MDADGWVVRVRLTTYTAWRWNLHLRGILAGQDRLWSAFIRIDLDGDEIQGAGGGNVVTNLI